MSDQLIAVVDGVTLAPEDARKLWQRFSAHMEAHQGDFDGFAAREGFARASVAVVMGRPTLTLASQPEAPAARRRGKKPWPKRKPGDPRRRKRRK